MVIASRTKRKYFRRVHSRISSQPSHGKILGSGRKGGTNTRCVKRVKFAVNRGDKDDSSRSYSRQPSRDPWPHLRARGDDQSAPSRTSENAPCAAAHTH